MNELIGSFAGKRLAAFGALIAAIALLAAGGALSTRTADAQTWITEANRMVAGTGLDHVVNNDGIAARKLTLAVGTRHHVCLMENLHGQRFRADSDTSDEPGDPANGDNTRVDSDKDGAVEANDDIDDWDWGVAQDSLADEDTYLEEVGPVGILTTVPRAATGSTGETSVTGWNWVIAQKANTAGTPTVTNGSRTFPNNGEMGEACVHWTSNAPGTQFIRLYNGAMLAAVGQDVVDIGNRAADFMYNRDIDADPPRENDDWKLDDFQYTDLEVTWVDSDPLIQVTRTVGNFAPTAVTAPIDQRVDFVGGDAATAAFTAETAAGVVVSVAAVQSALQSQALTGSSVSFAVTGTCGRVVVPGAVVSTSPVRVVDNIRPGQTGTIASWGTAAVTATFQNAGTGATDNYPKCRLANSSTTLTITSGEATNTVTVNWNWDGYGVFSQENVSDTQKKVTFHSATPRMYNALGQAVGWECDAEGQKRMLSHNVDGRATLTAGLARTQTVELGATGVVTPTSQGRATPQRTLGAQDSECQYTWTINSPARAADVYVDISTLGVDAFSEVLNFAPAAAPVTTFDDLDDPLAPGIDFIIWTGEDTRVADAIGDSGALAVYYWVSASQSWLSFFPGQEGLGVNSLTSLANGEIYVVSTPTN